MAWLYLEFDLLRRGQLVAYRKVDRGRMVTRCVRVMMMSQPSATSPSPMVSQELSPPSSASSPVTTSIIYFMCLAIKSIGFEWLIVFVDLLICFLLSSLLISIVVLVVILSTITFFTMSCCCSYSSSSSRRRRRSSSSRASPPGATPRPLIFWTCCGRRCCVLQHFFP